MDLFYQNGKYQRQFEPGPSSIPRNDAFYQPRRNNTNHTKKQWFDRNKRNGMVNHQIALRPAVSVSSESLSPFVNDPGKSRNYICPNCKHPYSYLIKNNILVGKVPKILPCKHTVCEECINKGIRTKNQIQCVLCSTNQIHKTQIYDYNHYVLGQITCSKFNRNTADIPNIALVSGEPNKMDSRQDEVIALFKEKCGFNNCSKSGTVSCLDCCGLYCKDCDDAIHKSGKHLFSHKRIPAKNVSLELSKCQEHSMDKDLYCKDCDVSVCCYCMLDAHEGHSRVMLSRLEEDDEIKLEEAYEQAKKTMKQLAVSRTKINKTLIGVRKETDVSGEIARCFADLHAQLHFVEKKLQEEAKTRRNNTNNLTSINQKIQNDISTLKTLIECVEKRKEKTAKFNVKVLLEKLEEMKDLPTVLVSSDFSEKPRVIVDEDFENLEKFVRVEVPEDVTYELIQMDELPEEYREDNSEVESFRSVSSPPSTSSLTSYQPKSETNKERSRYQVFMTHINSLDSFYVQLKEHNDNFLEMEREIKSHAFQHQAGVAEVFLKELYMAMRFNKWQRVKVMEKFDIGGEERFKVKFVDFGNTAVVKKEDLMYISSSLANRKPFAFECRLDNPSKFQWPKDTHLELAKILDMNRELMMYTKEISNNVSTVELDINTSSGSCSLTDILIFGCGALKTNQHPVELNKGLSNVIYDNSDSFSVGNSYKVFLRHLVDPWNIYIQKTSYEKTFNGLIEQMENYYDRTHCDIHIPFEKTFVVVNHKTENFGKWHRAKILEVQRNKKTVSVFLVDLGLQTVVSWKNLRKLSELFKKTEALVVRAKMADLSPPKDQNWSSNLYFFLQRYTKRNVSLKMLVSNNDPLEIILFEPEENHDVNINALLVKNKMAESTGSFTDIVKWLRSDNNEEKEDDNSVLFFRDETDDDEADDLRERFVTQIEMVHFESPSCFYVSFVFKNGDNEKLHEELQVHYKASKSPVKKVWNEGDKVVVFDERDKMYYRGVICSENEKKFCVDLLDKPSNLWVSNEKLRTILDYFENFPNSVFKCHFANIKPAGGSNKWSQQSLEWFGMLFKKYDELFMQKIGDDPHRKSMPVVLWYSKLIQGSALEPSYRKYISIDKKVVNFGLAFWVNNPQTFQPKEIKKEEIKPVEETEEIKEESDEKVSEQESTTSDETVVKKVVVEPVRITEWLPALKFNCNEFNAYILCAENLGYMYIRQEPLQEAYVEMERNMDKCFKNIPYRPFAMKENQIVTVRSNGHFYRSLILKLVDEETVRIMMVDFGSDHIVEKKDVFKNIMYPDVPIMASKVKLYDVSSVNKLWTDSEVDTFIETMPEYANIVLRGSTHTAMHLVDVYDLEGNCMNDKLVEKCPNLFRKSQKLEITNLEIETIIKPISWVEDCENALKESLNQENNENEEIIEEERNETTINKKYTYAKFTDEVSKKDIIDVYNYKTISFYHPDEESKLEDFETLIETIRENVEDQEPLKTEDIEVGLPCLSMFEEDQNWYRAKIVQLDSLDYGYVTVIYVDYGNFEVVKVSSLKSIKKEWTLFRARFVDATIDYNLLKIDQENILSKHIQSLQGQTKYVKVFSAHPVLVHVYDKKDDLFFYHYQAFVENSIVEI